MMPGAHILAGFSLGLRHRRELSRLLRTTPRNSAVLTLDPATLKANGITTLALDFDGVLSPHGCAEPLPAVCEWLSRCIAAFGEERIFILSNKPTEERRRWFAEHFPLMRFISGVRKKPFPDGLLKIGEAAGVSLAEVLMVDDRLLTGCLGAIHAGAQPGYIRSPYISLGERPFVESFFMLLRFGERCIVRLLRPF
ncbi:YqeG family HAD IIIA-type phosphatase [Geobacter sp. SVR]|uniref:YqeG family HAD IIIA-type phosphatase n=1 Tax=Geobacter sp. SVR TaxID=2495594 RepID=UPI00143EFE00|nr:HAD family hydrolase [Geobacter sp. SVR]BCS55134.1 haloacid dehalogenase [Geobacter sp. SVR]GCF85315.1 haloacid dehalogenase [Geobacter sp. SVR]